MAPLTYDQALKKGTRAEKAEHPWASAEEARQIAADHLAEDPHYYGKRRGVPRMVGRRRV